MRGLADVANLEKRAGMSESVVERLRSFYVGSRQLLRQFLDPSAARRRPPNLVVTITVE